jgi:AraC family transcriptional regulator
MKLNLVERPPLTVIGLQIHATPMSPAIPALWPQFVARIPEIAQATEGRVTYGVMQNVAGGMAGFDYLAAIAVADSAPVPPGMTRCVLPAGTYAVFRFPLSGLGAGFGDIFERLLPASGWVQGPGPYFERYGEDFCPDDASSPVEVWMPVATRGD